jgi:hypothetical protein
LKKIQIIFTKVLYTLFVGVWGILFGMHANLNLKGRNFNFQSVPQEKVVINFMAASILFISGGIAAWFIAKQYEAKKPYNAVLGTLIVMAGALGIKWLIGF